MTIAPAIWLQVTNQDIKVHSQYLLLHKQQVNGPNTSIPCLQYQINIAFRAYKQVTKAAFQGFTDFMASYC